jgi:hypothetical protein
MSRGFLAGERIVIFTCFVALFLVQVPIGPVVCAALFFLTIRRILASRRLDQAGIPAEVKNFEMKAFAGD